jgi:hypothetical protein
LWEVHAGLPDFADKEYNDEDKKEQDDNIVVQTGGRGHHHDGRRPTAPLPPPPEYQAILDVGYVEEALVQKATVASRQRRKPSALGSATPWT